MRASLGHLSDPQRKYLTLVLRHIHDAFQNTRASGKVFGLGRKLRRAADLADPEMIVLFGAYLRGTNRELRPVIVTDRQPVASTS